MLNNNQSKEKNYNLLEYKCYFQLLIYHHVSILRKLIYPNRLYQISFQLHLSCKNYQENQWVEYLNSKKSITDNDYSNPDYQKKIHNNVVYRFLGFIIEKNQNRLL